MSSCTPLATWKKADEEGNTYVLEHKIDPQFDENFEEIGQTDTFMVRVFRMVTEGPPVEQGLYFLTETTDGNLELPKSYAKYRTKAHEMMKQTIIEQMVRQYNEGTISLQPYSVHTDLFRNERKWDV